MHVTPSWTPRFLRPGGTEGVLAPFPRARFANHAWIVLVIALAGISYVDVLGNGFVWDDKPFIIRNESLRATGGLLRVFAEGDAFGTGLDNPYYRPVTTLSFGIDLWLFGENPAGSSRDQLAASLVGQHPRLSRRAETLGPPAGRRRRSPGLCPPPCLCRARGLCQRAGRPALRRVHARDGAAVPARSRGRVKPRSRRSGGRLRARAAREDRCACAPAPLNTCARSGS